MSGLCNMTNPTCTNCCECCCNQCNNHCGCNNNCDNIFGFCGNNNCCGCAGELVNAIIGITILQSILALIFGGFMGNFDPTGPN